MLQILPVRQALDIVLERMVEWSKQVFVQHHSVTIHVHNTKAERCKFIAPPVFLNVEFTVVSVIWVNAIDVDVATGKRSVQIGRQSSFSEPQKGCFISGNQHCVWQKAVAVEMKTEILKHVVDSVIFRIAQAKSGENNGSFVARPHRDSFCDGNNGVVGEDVLLGDGRTRRVFAI